MAPTASSCCLPQLQSYKDVQSNSARSHCEAFGPQHKQGPLVSGSQKVAFTLTTALIAVECVYVCEMWDRVQALLQFVMNAVNVSIRWKRLQLINTSITRRASAVATAIVFLGLSSHVQQLIY